MSQHRQVNIHGGGYHSGLDISTGANDPLYSIVDGVVYYTGYQANGYGNYIIIKDNNSNYAFLYGHMRDPAIVSVGQQVVMGQQVGVEGTTGNSTGIHTHVEMEDFVANGNTWIYNALDPTKWNVIYFDPCPYMGFPNQLGISVYYNGVPIPPIERKNFPWAVLTKNIRNRNKHF